MSDDGIKEVHGLYVRRENGNWEMLKLSEWSNTVWIEPNYNQLKMTPNEARYLAKQLVRLADRIDARLTPIATQGRSEGKARGGRARADSLTPERRREIAKKGAAARWGKRDAQQ